MVVLSEPTEAEFQRLVLDTATLFGWESMHVRRSVVRDGRWATATSVPGWPDLILWRPGDLLFVELKTDRGRISPDQRRVLASLAESGAEVHVWRPLAWPEIEERLRPRSRARQGDSLRLPPWPA